MISKLIKAVLSVVIAFLIVGNASEVRGRGFTLQKRYPGNKQTDAAVQ